MAGPCTRGLPDDAVGVFTCQLPAPAANSTLREPTLADPAFQRVRREHRDALEAAYERSVVLVARRDGRIAGTVQLHAAAAQPLCRLLGHLGGNHLPRTRQRPGVLLSEDGRLR